jgi:hypothetical protein
MSALPLNASTVFRRNTFGQFRDMLEQRLDSKFFRAPVASSLSLLGVAPSTALPFLKESPAVSPINILFIDPAGDVIADPTDASSYVGYSTNISLTAKTSSPYTDRDKGVPAPPPPTIPGLEPEPDGTPGLLVQTTTNVSDAGSLTLTQGQSAQNVLNLLG